MSTYLLLLLQMLADMGVPMMDEIGAHVEGRTVAGTGFHAAPAHERRPAPPDRSAGQARSGDCSQRPQTPIPGDDKKISNGF